MKTRASIIYNRCDGKRNAEVKSFRNTLEAFQYTMRRAAEKHAWTTKAKYL